MPQPQVHSTGKGREALRQKVLNLSFKIRYGLTVHIIRFYRQKVPNLSFKIRYGLTVHIIRFYRQNFQFFKIVPSSQIPANYANSAQFAHTVRELDKIRTFLLTFSIMFQVPAPAENPGKFQQITQIPHDSPT